VVRIILSQDKDAFVYIFATSLEEIGQWDDHSPRVVHQKAPEANDFQATMNPKKWAEMLQIFIHK
jgi:hypothetical protein